MQTGVVSGIQHSRVRRSGVDGADSRADATPARRAEPGSRRHGPARRYGAASRCRTTPGPQGPSPRAEESIWPGLLLAAGGGVLSVAVNRMVPALSALLVAIILGALLANAPIRGGAGLPD